MPHWLLDEDPESNVGYDDVRDVRGAAETCEMRGCSRSPEYAVVLKKSGQVYLFCGEHRRSVLTRGTCLVYKIEAGAERVLELGATR